MRHILLIVFALVVSSCATTNYYNKAITSWRGASADKLIDRWGPPTQIAKSASGNKVLVYTTERSPGYPQPLTPPAAVVVGKDGKPMVTSISRPMPNMQPELTCTTGFEVNKQNIIIGTKFFGKNCPTDEQFAHGVGQ